MLQATIDTPKNHYGKGVSICIPAYNEEQTIKKVVYDALETLNKSDTPGEILVLDDFSQDRTWAILQCIQRDVPILQTRRHKVNCGIAITFNELYDWASRELVFLISADRQWSMSILLDMLKLTDRYDLIISRRKKKQYDLTRHVISWMFNTLPILLFGTFTYDAGSVKLVRREIFEIPVISKGVFVEAERIIRAKRKGYKIGVLDVEHYPRVAGKDSGAKLALVTRSIADVIRCWIDIFLLSKSFTHKR